MMSLSKPTKQFCDDDLITCGICHIEMEHPRSLVCLHTYCLGCLREWSKGSKTDVICPLCREPTPLPPDGVDGLRSNFFVTKLKDRKDVSRQLMDKDVKIACSSCDVCDGNEAVARCLECDDFLCDNCFKAHKTVRLTKTHSVLTLVELRSGKVSLLKKSKGDYCKEHVGQVLWFYCKTCDVPICRDCTVVEHPPGSHELVKIDEAISGQREEIQKLAECCKVKKEEVDKAFEKVHQMRQNLESNQTALLLAIDKKKKVVKRSLLANLEKQADDLKKNVAGMISRKEKETAVHEDELQVLNSRLKTALDMASHVTREGSDCDIASIFKLLTTSLQQLGKITTPSTSTDLGSVRFQEVSSMKISLGNIGSIEEGSRTDSSHGSDRSAEEITGAFGGVKETPSESLIQSILVQHGSGIQTPEQAAETQKLLDNLLGGDDPGLGGYDLHSDARVKRSCSQDDDSKKCSVCYSRRDLTTRTDCEHNLCKGCHRLGLHKGSCGICKRKQSRSLGTDNQKTASSDDHRGRSRTRKTPLTDSKTLTPRGGITTDFHIRPASSGISGNRKGPMTADSPPTTPEWKGTGGRLEPVGQAPDQRYGSSSQYRSSSAPLPDSTKGHSRTEDWVVDSTIPSNPSTSKEYNHRTYTSANERSSDNNSNNNENGSSRFSARERRRQDQALVDEKNDRSLRARTGDSGKGGGLGTLGRAGGDNETCPICMDVMRNPKTLSECKHTFCAACINKAMKLKALCPICGEVYGQLYGNQPAGTMTSNVEPTDLPGYEGCGTIVISYRFPDGVQGDDHSNPGQPFRGTARMAYIPNNIEGQWVFRLLEKAFKARLLFTIGQSVTTGEHNCVIWNGVHHKTRRTGGAENHGYPDPGYLRRVRDELFAKGIK